MQGTIINKQIGSLNFSVLALSFKSYLYRKKKLLLTIRKNIHNTPNEIKAN